METALLSHLLQLLLLAAALAYVEKEEGYHYSGGGGGFKGIGGGGGGGGYSYKGSSLGGGGGGGYSSGGYSSGFKGISSGSYGGSYSYKGSSLGGGGGGGYSSGGYSSGFKGISSGSYGGGHGGGGGYSSGGLGGYSGGSSGGLYSGLGGGSSGYAGGFGGGYGGSSYSSGGYSGGGSGGYSSGGFGGTGHGGSGGYSGGGYGGGSGGYSGGGFSGVGYSGGSSGSYSGGGYGGTGHGGSSYSSGGLGGYSGGGYSSGGLGGFSGGGGGNEGGSGGSSYSSLGGGHGGSGGYSGGSLGGYSSGGHGGGSGGYSGGSYSSGGLGGYSGGGGGYSSGDACTKKDGAVGVCSKLLDCLEARTALIAGQPYSLCSFDGITRVVCCLDPPKTPPPPADSSERVAVRMCGKYGEAVFRYENSSDNRQQKGDKCAIPGRLARAVGGTQALPSEFPHMAHLGYGEDPQRPKWLCGGSLISERFVLSAAHCFTTRGDPLKVVRLGEVNHNTTEMDKHLDIGVAESIPHPEHRWDFPYNDVGLIRLAAKVTFTASIQPACLHPVHDIADTEALATGWGSTDPNSLIMSDHLMKVKLPIHKIEICQNAYSSQSNSSFLRKGVTEESMVCAGPGQQGQDTCTGDTGGPLTVKLENPYCMYSVVGITSFGSARCGTLPAIYTRVSFYLSWIEGIVWPDQIDSEPIWPR